MPHVYESNRGGKMEQIMSIFKEENSEFSEMAEISRNWFMSLIFFETELTLLNISVLCLKLVLCIY